MSEYCALFTYRAHALTHADRGQPRICEHEQPSPKTERIPPCSIHLPAVLTSPYLEDGAEKKGESKRAREGQKARELAMFNAGPPK
ncbi:hypothetical protein NCS56_01543200 [Fusarium sp. Ph1]|nr:hypothetical protein NCS56_01543200 [Fusarium sp. Ph1]